MQSCDCNYVEQQCILVDQHFNLKQPGKVDGGTNRSDTAHHGVAAGGDRGQKKSNKVIRYIVVKQKDQQEHSGHLETKIMEAAQATRYPPEAEKKRKRLKDVQVQI